MDILKSNYLSLFSRTGMAPFGAGVEGMHESLDDNVKELTASKIENAEIKDLRDKEAYSGNLRVRNVEEQEDGVFRLEIEEKREGKEFPSSYYVTLSKDGKAKRFSAGGPFDEEYFEIEYSFEDEKLLIREDENADIKKEELEDKYTENLEKDIKKAKLTVGTQLPWSSDELKVSDVSKNELGYTITFIDNDNKSYLVDLPSDVTSWKRYRTTGTLEVNEGEDSVIEVVVSYMPDEEMLILYAPLKQEERESLDDKPLTKLKPHEIREVTSQTTKQLDELDGEARLNNLDREPGDTKEELKAKEKETKKQQREQERINDAFEDLLHKRLDLLAEKGETALLETLESKINIYTAGLDQQVAEIEAIEEATEAGRLDQQEAAKLMGMAQRELLLQLARINHLFETAELPRGFFSDHDGEFDSEFRKLLTLAGSDGYNDRPFREARKVAKWEQDFYTIRKERKRKRIAKKLQRHGYGFAIGLKPGVEVGKDEDWEKRYVRVRYPQSKGKVERVTGQEALNRGVTEYTYLTQDGLVTEKHLHKMSLDEIFGVAEQYDLSKDTIEAKTIKSALLRQVILEGATTDSRVIARMGGWEAFWSLMDDVLVDSQFSKDLHTRYRELRKIGEALTKDQRIQDHEEFKEKFYGLSMWNDDEIMTAALVDTLSDAAQEKEGWNLPKEKTRPRELLNLFRGAEGEIDFAQISTQANILYKGETPLYEEPSRWDQARKGGLMKGINSILANQVAEGNISKEFAANTSSFLHKAGNLVDKAPVIALAWHGVRAVRHTLGALGKVVVGDWAGAGAAFKEVGKDIGKGLLWGVGLRMGFDALKGESPWNPRGWGEHIHPLTDSDEEYEQRMYDEQIESGILFETETVDDLVRGTIGSKTIDQLMTPPPVLKTAPNGALLIDRDVYIEQYPDAAEDPDLDKKILSINQTLAEYGFTAELAKKLDKSEKPFMKIIDELKYIDDSTSGAREVLRQGTFPQQPTVAELYLLEEAERTKKIERMQFTAQQWAKLNPEKLSDWAWEQMKEAGTAEKPMGTRPGWGPDFWLGKAMQEMLKATDTKGNSGEAFLRAKLEDVLKGGTTKEITDYFRGVNIVFNNQENIELGWQKPDEAALYVDGGTKGVSFVEYIHDYNPLGTGTPLAAGYRSPGMGDWNSSQGKFNPKGDGNTWGSILESTYTLSPEETETIEPSGTPIIPPTVKKRAGKPLDETSTTPEGATEIPDRSEETSEEPETPEVPETIDPTKKLDWGALTFPESVNNPPEAARSIELNQEDMSADILVAVDSEGNEYFEKGKNDLYTINYSKLQDAYPDTHFLIPTGFSYDFRKIQGKVFRGGVELSEDEPWFEDEVDGIRPVVLIDKNGKISVASVDSTDEEMVNTFKELITEKIKNDNLTAFQMPDASASYLENATTKTPRFLIEKADGGAELVELTYEEETSVAQAAEQLKENFKDAQHIIYFGTGKGSYEEQLESTSDLGAVLALKVSKREE